MRVIFTANGQIITVEHDPVVIDQDGARPLIPEGTKPVVQGYNKINRDRQSNLQDEFDAIPKPVELKPIENNHWVFQTGEGLCKSRCSVVNTKYNIIRIHIHAGSAQAHIHIYPNLTSMQGITPEYLPAFLKWSGFPISIQKYILDIAAL